MEVSHDVIKKHLADFVRKARLESFFNALQIERAATTAERAVAEWPSQMAQILPYILADWKQFSLSVSRLALYDIHLLVDQDSTIRSGTRWRHLQEQVQKTAEIVLPFVTSNRILMHSCDASTATQISAAVDVSRAFESLDSNSPLPIGLALKQKVLPSMLRNINVLQRPCLVYAFTTGERVDGSETDLAEYIGKCKNDLRQYGHSSSALAVEVVQIGRSHRARQALGILESAYGPNDFVDVSCEDRVEDRYRQEQGWCPATPAVLAIRNLVGAIEPRFLDSRKRIDDLSLYATAAESEKELSQVRQELQARLEEMQRVREEEQRKFQAQLQQRTQETSAELARLRGQIQTQQPARVETQYVDKIVYRDSESGATAIRQRNAGLVRLVEVKQHLLGRIANEPITKDLATQHIRWAVDQVRVSLGSPYSIF